MALKEYTSGEKVIWKDKVYDFGYYSQVKGKVVIYEEGERNMQDSLAVKESEIERAHCEDPENTFDVDLSILNLEYMFNRYVKELKRGKANTRMAYHLKTMIDVIQVQDFINDIKSGRENKQEGI